MPFVPVPNVARVALVFQDTSGNEAVNVQHFRDTDTGITPAKLIALAIQIEAWAFADWAPMAASAWKMVRIELRDLTEEDSFYHVENVSITGTESGQALPSQNTIAVSLRSPFVGRSRRGRLFHVGLSEAATNGDYIIGTSRDVIIAGYDALRQAVQLIDWVWVVVSYVSNGVPRVSPLVTTITAVTVTDDIVDSMDKRKPSA